MFLALPGINGTHMDPKRWPEIVSEFEHPGPAPGHFVTEVRSALLGVFAVEDPSVLRHAKYPDMQAGLGGQPKPQNHQEKPKYA